MELGEEELVFRFGRRQVLGVFVNDPTQFTLRNLQERDVRSPHADGVSNQRTAMGTAPACELANSF